MTGFVTHWQPPLPAPEGPACQPSLLRRAAAAYALTVQRAIVTCPACQHIAGTS